jgi:penicillin-binding protein 2
LPPFASLAAITQSCSGVDRALVVPEDMGLDPAHVAVVHSGMDAVTNQGGTGARSRIDIDGFDMAGKTGTAQVRKLTAGLRGRNSDSIPWKFRDHGLFIAFAPVVAPRYAISVVVEHGGGGSKAAAPIAKEVMTVVAQRDPARQKMFVPPVRTASGPVAKA